MKKIILLFTITSLLFSCSNGGNASSNNNNPTSGTNVDYEFTITINGQVHKIKGNTTNGVPSGFSNIYNTTNQCQASIGGGITCVYLKINDVSAPNYISGQNLECRIQFPNLLMGTNQAQIMFIGSYFDSLYTNAGYTNPVSGICNFQTTNGTYNLSIANKLPINITDLGTNTTNIYTSIGQTLKGNYSGTIYLERQNTTTGAHVYDIPVTLSIDFKAIRNY